MSETTNETEAPRTSRATSRAETQHGELLRPPYVGYASGECVFYSVAPRQLRAVVPEEFKPIQLFGKAFVMVLATYYKQVYSYGSAVEGPPYMEIAYAVPASWKDPIGVRHNGLYFLKLYLNQQLPTDSGIVYYGFPKELAHVVAKEEARDVAYDARTLGGHPVFNLSAQVRRGPLAFLLGLAIEVALRLWTIFMGKTQGFFILDGRHVWCEFTGEPYPGAVRPLTLRSSYLPDLVNMGLLRPGRTQRPVAGFFFNRAIGTIGAPMSYGPGSLPPFLKRAAVVTP